MKKTITLISVSIALILVSCQKGDVYYSCDKKADKWVKAHIQEVQNMTRTQWLDMNDYELRMASYVAFTPKQKGAFWENKIDEVMYLDWTEEELSHISKLYDIIRILPLFTNNESTENDSLTDQLEKFMYIWQEYAIDSLNWSKKIIHSIVISGDKMTNTDVEILKSPSAYVSLSYDDGSGGNLENCTCSTACVYCNLDDTIATAMCKIVKDCNKVRKCGFFWRFVCDGFCRPPVEGS